VSDLGKQLRLGRIFHPASHNTMVVPVDQGIEDAGFHQLATESANRIFADLIDGGRMRFLPAVAWPPPPLRPSPAAPGGSHGSPAAPD